VSCNCYTVLFPVREACWLDGCREVVCDHGWCTRCCQLDVSRCLWVVVTDLMADFYPLSVPSLETASADELAHVGDGLLTESPSSLSCIKQEPTDITVSVSCFQDRDIGAIADSNSCGSGQQPFIACRVCGDKASGYHYGVTSCEGCKVSSLFQLVFLWLCHSPP